MAGPTLTDVVTDMLSELGARLPAPVPALPDPNVTLERVAEKLVGLGNQLGLETTGSLGARTLRGGRLDARVRFQVWAPSAPEADSALLSLHTNLLEDASDLRRSGFLRLAASGTTLAELVDTVGWRKATSFDVLYEYRFVDTDAAASLIARIPVTTDLDASPHPVRERPDVTDAMVRWDEGGAPALVVVGTGAVHRLTALAFVPGPPLGGTVTIARTTTAPGPAAHLADLPAFLAATGGPSATGVSADVVLDAGDFLAALGAPTPALDMGDWDVDGTLDTYTGFDLAVAEPIVLAATDRFTVTYAPPAGPAIGLDQRAVLYLRVNSP